MRLDLFFNRLNEEAETFTPPKDVSNAAQRALDARKEHGNKVKGGTRVGWTRANQLAKQEPVSYDTIKRMYSFFSRHEGNQKVKPEHKDFKWADSGYTAWMIWGGDPGKRWATSVRNKMKKQEESK